MHNAIYWQPFCSADSCTLLSQSSFLGNMTDINSMKNALKVQSLFVICVYPPHIASQGAYCVIHTASPTAGAKTANQRDFYFLFVFTIYGSRDFTCAARQTWRNLLNRLPFLSRVNVKGTKNVIDACIENVSLTALRLALGHLLHSLTVIVLF